MHALLSKTRLDSLSRDWAQAGQAISLGQFLDFSAIASVAISFSAFLIFLTLSFQLPESAAFSSILLCLLLLLALRLPSLLASRRARQIEADLPMALREFSLYLDIKLPFEKALEAISSSGHASSPVFSNCLKSIRSGAPVQQALSECAPSVKSTHFARALNLMSSAYEEGGGGGAISSFADDLSSIGLANIREYGGKISFFGLVFIASAALLPAFFLIFIIGTGAFSDVGAATFSVYAFYLLAVPFANAAVLSAIFLSAPTTYCPSESHSLDLEADLQLARFHLNFNLRKNAIPATFVFFLAGACFAALLSFSAAGIFLLIAIAGMPCFALGFAYMAGERRILQIESELPSALMAAASPNKAFSLERSLYAMSKACFGPLSGELLSLSRQIGGGVNVADAISAASSRTPSALFRRFLQLMQVGYKTGANMHNALRKASDDMLSVFSLVRERSSALSLQRYTIMASAVIVPVILGTVIGLAGQLAATFASLPPSVFGSSASTLPALAGAAKIACQFYLVIFALMSASFLSLQEGRRDRLFFYAMLLLALSQISWIAATL